MKNLKSAIAISALALGFLGCEEEPLEIKLQVGERKVLVEELTGVQCSACPQGTAALNTLSGQFGENLIVVSIHAAPGFDIPLPESKYDFRTADGNAMASFIGEPLFFPTAAVNRFYDATSGSAFLERIIWGGTITQQSNVAPEMELSLSNEFDVATRQLNITLNISPEIDNRDDLRVTVLITEDSIQDAQINGVNKELNYMHRHVLRDVVTSTSGDEIGEKIEAGKLISRKFAATLPATWNAEKCSVVAYVHRSGTPDKEVVQVVEEHLH